MRPLTNVQTGTLGGTLCSLFGSIALDDIVKTMILAAIGAIVSFVVSRWLGRIERNRGHPPIEGPRRRKNKL